MQTLCSCCVLAIVYVSIDEGSLFVLFCLSWGDLLNHGTPPNIILGTGGQPSMGRGALLWFCSVGSIEYQTIVLENSIKSKLNSLGKLGCSMSRIYGGDFLIFRQMVKEIQMNFE